MDRKRAEIYAKKLDTFLTNIFHGFRGKEKILATEAGLTMPQFFVMMIVDAKGSRKMSELAELLSLNFGTATGIVDRLVRDGYLKRQRDEKDRRVVRVYLTDKGKSVIVKVQEKRRERLVSLLEKINEEDFEDLFAIFQRILPAIMAGLRDHRED
ncbi:MarR family transcriptional regulator [Candidatus Oleimmundimicrobium sp.]|uniref:MarR family winged helix-turn-helix transcriptional regulator n=1 Tax=Candidatus Oleimmundimicrobium sp. TaxID=3060597 RepID=UPI00271B0C49|nr:MarR family transcriptional regulator [Candidatus Oleimmundimicrobium sp.]MDO8886832.1 MarR family transcriptional regulator [Candidatus Oleimmundimicrobium sp.]